MKIIHGALVAGVVIFAAVVSQLIWDDDLLFSHTTEANIFYIILGAMVLWALFGGELIFRNQIKKAKIQPALSLKMMQYQSANIVKYSMVEGVALFAVVAAMLTSLIWFVIIAIGLVLLLVSYHPTIDKTIKELELNVEEQKQVRNAEAYISELHDNN